MTRDVEHYNLDAIIAVGYRANNNRATQFRIWATKTLKKFIIKGLDLATSVIKFLVDDVEETVSMATSLTIVLKLDLCPHALPSRS